MQTIQITLHCPATAGGSPSGLSLPDLATRSFGITAVPMPVRVFTVAGATRCNKLDHRKSST